MRGPRASLASRAAPTAFAAVLLLLPALAAAGVEVKPGPTGRTTVTNDGEPATVRRPAPRRPEPRRSRSAGTEDLLGLIDREARRQGLDPRLVRSVVQAESAWDPAAVSTKGAMGLMQLMPTTARALAVNRPFQPGENVRGGTVYLKRLLDRFGDVRLALAAYNAGPEAVKRYGGVPPYPETVRYVRRVLALWQGDAAPKVEPAAGVRRQPRAPARPVVWRSNGERAHLTNID